MAKTVTYEEWLEMPIVDEGIEEVVDGEIILFPPAHRTHARIVANLMGALQTQVDEARYDVLAGSLGVVIRRKPLTCRNPDLVVFDRRTVVEVNGYFESAPQLAIEVLSPSETRRLTERKLRDYEDIGTPEVWIVSPEAGTVEVLLLENGRLRRAAILAEGILNPRELPQVQIDIGTIWPD